MNEMNEWVLSQFWLLLAQFCLAGLGRLAAALVTRWRCLGAFLPEPWTGSLLEPSAFWPCSAFFLHALCFLSGAALLRSSLLEVLAL